MKIPAKNAGSASPISVQSMSLKEEIIRIPTITRTGAVAADGTILTKLERNAERANITATTTDVRPVLPPAPIPAALSTNVVVLDVPKRAPMDVATASAKRALSRRDLKPEFLSIFSSSSLLSGISIWWVIVPGYAISLILTFVVPDIFTSIAFDSGGVASGPMTATFLLPFAVGACSAVDGGNIVTDAYGLVALVAMTPLISIQILGLVYKIKQTKQDKELAARKAAEPVVVDDDVIDM